MKTPTKAQANLAIDLAKAIAEDKKIQVDLGKGKFELLPITTETSTFEGILKLLVEGKKLRVKPLPSLVPWTYAQWEKKFIDPNFYVICKVDSHRKTKIIGITKTSVSPFNYGPCSFDYMARNFTGPNGELLGTYEE